jgi:hypothetical protein
VLEEDADAALEGPHVVGGELGVARPGAGGLVCLAADSIAWQRDAIWRQV